MSSKQKQATVRIQARVTVNSDGAATEVSANVTTSFANSHTPRVGQLERLIRDTARAAKEAWWRCPTNSGEEITVTMSRIVPAAKEC